MCLCDSNGSFIQAHNICISQSLPVREGEALGVLEAIQWVHALGYSKVIIELQSGGESLKGSASASF